MNIIIDIVQNKSIQAAFIAWLVAQVLKVPIGFMLNKKWDLKKVFQSGGMPSSHSSSFVATATTVGFIEGFSSSIFAVAVVVSIVVMYDAAGVRRDAGRHAAILNDMLETFKSKKIVTGEKLREWIGHTPFEVLVGAAIGIIIGIISSNI